MDAEVLGVGGLVTVVVWFVRSRIQNRDNRKLEQAKAADRRRRDASEQLWQRMVQLSRAKQAVTVAFADGDIGERIVLARADPLLRDFFQTHLNLFCEVKFGEADGLRPFVPVRVWSLFAAYEAIMSLTERRLRSLAQGSILPAAAFDPYAFVRTVSAALPSQRVGCNYSDPSDVRAMLDELEQQLHDELALFG